MSEENREFATWEDVIIDFFQNKIDSEEEKYLKDEIAKIAQLYEKNNYFDSNEMREFFDTKKNKKTTEQSSLEFQRYKFYKIFDFNNKPTEINEEEIKSTYSKTLDEVRKKFNPEDWIMKASKDAKNVTFATHVFKLTHSKIDSPSLFDQVNATKSEVLTTSNLRKKIVDGAVMGNQFAPVFQFLELEFNGVKLASKFASESNPILSSFTNDTEALRQWNTGFKKALSSQLPRAHSLAKQVYFPVNESFISDSYHLLINVKSSSLAHTMYLKLAGKQQKDDKYSNSIKTSFVNKAALMVTQSNHGNASQLNGKRGGKLNLLSSQPPTWQTPLKPPENKSSLFDAITMNAALREDIEYLRDFLLRFERIELSFKDPKKMAWIERWVNQIVDEVFAYCASIQNLPSGWSQTEDIKLKQEHRYFLDPYRKDDDFQAARKNNEWQAVVCDDFSRWLNHKLRGKDKTFTPQAEHTRIWKNLMQDELRVFDETVEMDIKNRQEQIV